MDNERMLYVRTVKLSECEVLQHGEHLLPLFDGETAVGVDFEGDEVRIAVVYTTRHAQRRAYDSSYRR
jgi:hypothetical protein